MPHIRRTSLLAVWCMVTFFVCGGIGNPLVAQDGGAPPEDEFAQPDGVAADVAAPGAPAGGAPADGGIKNEPESTPKISALGWFFKALGIPYTLAFFLLSFVFVALAVMCALSSRRENFCPAYLIEGFEENVNNKKYQEAYDLAKADDSFLGRILSSGLAKLNVGYPQAIESMQEVAEDENMKIEHRLSYIALIGTISPMVGLLGTVDGMVRAFSLIAISNTTPKPSELAAGVSTALVTTLVGLLIAIPAIGVFNILKNRFARMVLEVGMVSEGLMSRFQSIPVKK
jgi:biopolymer transport protein ExbB